MMRSEFIVVIVIIALVRHNLGENGFCSKDDTDCASDEVHEKYSKRIYCLTLLLVITHTNAKLGLGPNKCNQFHDLLPPYLYCHGFICIPCLYPDSNTLYAKIKVEIRTALDLYAPCESTNCGCHKSVIDSDLTPYEDGISKDLFTKAASRGTKYQIIQGKVYREKDCHFPARCAGVEHYLTMLAPKLPDLELAVNTRDWPQFNRAWGHQKAPIFSFSKTSDYYDIMYPAWSFWEGGPAISLYPTGIGRWDKHRISISNAAEKWPWETKDSKAFFRGSRTSEERDPLILLSRSDPDLVDAQYTKNQAWKSDADTLYAPPASEVSFEDHCKYKYLFNYRGVAASFRLKHLFLCKSLVFHVGNEWLEFFYPSLKPWVHYVPVSPTASKEEIKQLIRYFKENDTLSKEIAERGFQHIWDNLTDRDVKCYWRKLLKKYSKLVKYDVKRDNNLVEVL